MSAVPAAPSSAKPFQHYLDLAVADSESLAAHAVAVAVKSLTQAAAAAIDLNERKRLADASEALRRVASAAAQAFPALLREEVRNAASASASPAKAFSFESLELMAEDQVDDTVELLRGQQAVTSAVEAELVAFNALASAAQGRERVSASSNPLRPEVWMRALHRALGKTHSTPAARASWMLHVARGFGPGLAQLYRSLTERMAREGIAAAAYGITPQDTGRRRVAGEGAGPTLRDLKRLLANVARGDGATQGLTRPGGETMNGMTMPAAMEALQGMKQVDDVVRRMQERWRKGVWRAEPAAEGEGAAQDGSYTPTQTLAREVARLMIANVAADERLLPDVQDAVRQLEPAVLRLVQHDQRVFVDRQHPARLLLDEMTQRSLAWPQRNAPGFLEFFAPLRDAVEMLAQMPLEDEEPFLFALQMLRQSWDEAEERTRRQRASMARTLLKTDARNHAATEFAQRLSQRPDVVGAPEDVRRFLLGPWCQVMAAARLTAGPKEQDPGGHEALIQDILWSCQPQLTAQEPERLARMAAPLMQRLRSALSGTGVAQDQAEEMLQGVLAAHARGLGGAPAAAQAAPAPAPAFEPTQGAGWDAETQPWMTPAEMGGAALVAPPAVGEASRTEALRPGQYVEMQVQGRWTRWRLTWASPHGTMLMFVDASGRPESMTRQMLDKMLDIGAIRLLASGSAVDSALDAVAQAALENSTQWPD